MSRTNRKTENERPSQEDAHDWHGYRIPRINRVNNEADRQNSPNRGSNHPSRSRSRAHASHQRRRSTPSPRRTNRDISLNRLRRRAELRRRLGSREVSPPSVQFREHVEHIPASSPVRYPERSRNDRRISPSRRRYSLDRRQQPIRHHRVDAPPAVQHLGPHPENHHLVRVVQQPRTQVLKFPNVSPEVSLSEFLRLLSRGMTGVTGASRVFNYKDEQPGDSIFVYAVIQDEIDAAVNQEMIFEFSSGSQTIKPILQSATIMSIMAADAISDDISLVPTLMIRNLTSITTRQAITAAIDAVETVTHAGATVTHVRVLTKDLGLVKTSSIAFIGITTASQVTELDGYVNQRLVKNIPFNKSIQAPVLIPTGMTRQKRDKEWTKRAAKINMLVHRNPFE